MARIVCAWELGGDRGHVARLGALGHALADRGHEVTLALKDLGQIGDLAGPSLGVMQAPVWSHRTPCAPDPPLNLTEILLHCGYAEPSSLCALVRGWRALLASTRAELVIADHAPTAMLAAHSLDIPAVQAGTGFAAPPPGTPLPVMRPWLGAPSDRLERSEQQVSRALQRVLESFDCEPLESVGELLKRARASFLLTFEELDHYPGRRAGRYLGAFFSTAGEAPPRWPSTGGDRGRVFAYLNPRHPGVLEVLSGLAVAGHAVLAYVPGLGADRARGLGAPNMRFCTAAPGPSSIAPTCDVALCHGGHGTVAAMLLAGVPLLLLPNHVEQELTARRVAELGAGLWSEPAHAAGQCRRALQRLLEAGEFSRAATAFSQRHRDFDPAMMVNFLANEIGALLS